MSVEPFPRTTSVNHCKATNVNPNPIPSGTPIIKVPVLLKELSVQIPIHAEITFPQGENVLEVKTIGKKVFVTQCRLIHRNLANNLSDYMKKNKSDPIKAKLFLSGFVRKNIQYASNPAVDDDGEILSTIKSLTVEVPWDCVAEVENFLNLPMGPLTDTRAEFGYLVSQPLPSGRDFAVKDRLEGTDLSQFHQISTQFFNEMPFCELVVADIIEIDESLDRVPFTGGKGYNQIVGEGTFTRLSEKMILDLTLKLLQQQQVRVPSVVPVARDIGVRDICEGCACDQLRDLAINTEIEDIIVNGESIDKDDIFLIGFDTKNCCAHFIAKENGDLVTFTLDCRKIDAIFFELGN